MDIVEPVEKAAALHVDAGETAKVVVEAEVHTNIDSLKRRHSEEVAREHENEAKKPKTSNNGENAEEDDDDDLIAKLDAIEAPVLSNEITKPADLLKKLEEDGKSDDLLERMECIVEGKTPSHSTRQTDTDNGVVTKPEEVPQVDERPKEEAIKSAEEKEAPKPAEAKEEPKKVEISQNKEESKKPEKEEPKRVEEIKKDVPKVEEVKEAQPSKPEEPKEQAEAKSEDTKMPKVKVAEVEKMEVDGDVKAEGKSPKKTAPVAENDENVISSTTECVTFEKKETPPPKAAPEPKNSPKETLSNIPASKPAPAAKELPPMAVAKEKPAEVKKDEKEMPRENDKETAKVIEKIEETPKKTAEERKDAEALPAEKVVEAAKMQKQHNGLITSTDPASTTSDEEKEMKMEVDGEAEAKSPVKDTPSISNGEDLADAVVKENTYEVKFCFEENDIKYLYIDKMTKDGVNGNEKNTTTSQSTTDESSNTDKFAVPTQPNSTVTIKGISSLCSFIVERMRMLNPVEEKKVVGRKSLGAKTPTSTSKSQKASPAVTKVTSSGRRSTGKTSTTSTPVKASSTTTKADSGAKDSKVGYSVMARWVDKMYYAGKVSAEKTGGKFVIHFEDGALKTLQRDNIVFGHENLLPFLNQSVHALVEGDTYEPGLVTEVAMDPDGQILYTVIAESKTVVRSASDIYLEDDQAKSIQAAIKDNPQTGLVDLATVKRVSRRSSSASESDGSSRKNSRKSDSKEAEAGFSGGDAKKGRRGKRKIK